MHLMRTQYDGTFWYLGCDGTMTMSLCNCLSHVIAPQQDSVVDKESEVDFEYHYFILSHI